jgi:hypothetical protein
MAKIRGIEGLAYDQIQMELRAGARFVEYPYCISVGFMTLRRVSDIYYFSRNGRGSVFRRLGYSVISSLFGWWVSLGVPSAQSPPSSRTCGVERTSPSRSWRPKNSTP